MEFVGTHILHSTSDVKVVTEAKHTERPMTLHCQHCNTVLGDSLGVCGEIMDSIICLKVTHDVIVSNSLESRQEEREISDCICSSLRCRGCHSAVGKVIHSAPLHLDMVRSLFLLNKEHISCYIINSSSVVRASAFQFNLKALGDSIEEVRQLFDEHLDQIVHIKSRLATRSEPCEFKQ